jgi:hypothetical protein
VEDSDSARGPVQVEMEPTHADVVGGEVLTLGGVKRGCATVERKVGFARHLRSLVRGGPARQGDAKGERLPCRAAWLSGVHSVEPTRYIVH